MNDATLTLVESVQDDNKTESLPLCIIDKVVVHNVDKLVSVRLKPPFGNLDTERMTEEENTPEDRLRSVEAYIALYRQVERILTTEFIPLGANVQILPSAEFRPSKSVLRVIMQASVSEYAATEAVAGNWLKQAELSIHDDTPIDDDPAQSFVVTYMLRNQSEVDALTRKEASFYLTETLRKLFGIDVRISLTVDGSAVEKTAAMRERLTMMEMEEAREIAVREVESAKQEKQQPRTEERSQNWDKPYRPHRTKGDDEPAKPLCVGRTIDADPTPIKDIVDEMRRVVVEGEAFAVDIRTLPSGRVLAQFNLTDYTSSITAKLFTNNDKQIAAIEPLADGSYVRVAGQVQFDTYSKEIVLMIQDMQPVDRVTRQDTAEKKRVELHVHSNMSALDGIVDISEVIKQAAKWGHEAIAITDHGVVQSFPEAYSTGKKHGVKVLLGLEAYVVDDGTPLVYRPADIALDDTEYVVFDTETTGLNAREDTLIEIAAVRLKAGQILDTFSTLIDPLRMLSHKITEITGISQDMLSGQPTLETVLPQFAAFAKGAVLVAHNAEFDVGFLGQCAQRIGMAPFTEPVVDTLAVARSLYPGEKNYRLKTLTQKFEVELVNHHRALADAEATAKVFVHMLADLKARDISLLSQLNDLSGGVDVTRIRPFHATLLVKDKTGLRNLYELVSLSHTKYLHRVPRVPKSELARLREGLLIGTACNQGELIQGFLRGKSIDEIEELSRFYDFLEIQPLSHYDNLIREELVESKESVRHMHREIVEMGRRLNKPVVATGDVHYVHPHQGVFREVFLQSQHGPEIAERQPPLHFRTTDEMLGEFEYLSREDAQWIVVEAPKWVAEQTEDVKPIPDTLFTPVIDGAEDEITRMSYDKARRLYGDDLPEIVEARLQKELNSIIKNGFAVIYLIAHKLVTKSLSDGYLVGSRGSVGSSLVATMTDITEVNPLPPHYRCPNCRHSQFFEDGKYGSGFDLPPMACPHCGTDYVRDGQDIPFETFLGFEGDKVPDIDLNFSGEYQPRAHRYTEELFGRDHVFRAGTIATVAEKTAYGYVRKFAEERGMILRNAEVDRLVRGCTGIKRTTGQHPGGQIVVPGDMSIYDFTPVQYPADDKDSGTLTTHLDYHSGLENCLLKLDILGHDDPTVIRMLQDLTGVDPKAIPLDDPLVLGLFSGTDTLGVKQQEIRSVTGTYAIPEFGTKFVRQMLEDTRPTTFSELVRISGLSHGTDVWLNNAQELIKKGTATLSEVICARDDIMVYLIYKGLEPGKAFKIMESIRKGKGVKEEDAEYMRSFGVPEWYIESGRRIKYMFPKAHATAYVLMATRIAWFKIHHPLAFYATYYTVRADEFDVLLMQGKPADIVRKIEEIEQKGNAALPKEKGLLTVLEVALEMTVRGYRFLPVDLYSSHATKFTIVEDEKALLPPFAAIPGVGAAAANNLYQARQDGPFLSIEDLQARSRVSKTVIEILDGLGCLQGMPESNQLSLF